MDDSVQLSEIEFADRLLRAAVDPNRLALVIAGVVGDTIEVRSVPVGPGGLVSVSAGGRARGIRVVPSPQDFREMSVRVPIVLGLRVDLAGLVARFAAIVCVTTRIRLLPQRPCALSVEIEPIGGEQISSRLYARDPLAKLLKYVIPIDALIEGQIRRYVNEVLESPQLSALRYIDVTALIEQAWQAGMVLAVPPGQRVG